MKISKSIKITAVLALAMAAFGFVNSAQAVAFNYVGNPGNNSEIVFPGDTHFSINPGLDNFIITTGSCFGCHGDMTGTFTIGTIVVDGFHRAHADVTGTGTFVIHDGSGFDLTATLEWKSIAQVGTLNGLNFNGQVNLTGISYLGTNADLVALAAAGSGVNTLTFQFASFIPLSRLRNGPGPIENTFSGTVASVPDGGTTVMLLGAALGVIGIARRALKR